LCNINIIFLNIFAHILAINKIYSKQMKKIFLLKIVLISFTLILTNSCNIDDLSQITQISVSPTEKGVLLVGSTVELQVRGNNSTDITEESTFKVNGVEIEGNTFITENEPKTYHILASYKDFENIISITTAKGFVRNVLIEDYTGTWCVNCPRVTYAIEQAKSQSDKVVSVGIHNDAEMIMDQVSVLINEFGINSYPTARLNRVNDWVDDVNNIEGALELTGYGSDLGLAINSTISGSNIEATIKIGFENTITKPIKLVIYLTENGLLFNQSNSTPYYGGLHLLVDFEHNDVLRAIYTDHLGEVIPNSETITNNVYEFALNQPIAPIVANYDNIHLVAFVTDAITNEVLNVREVKVGENQEFQKP